MKVLWGHFCCYRFLFFLQRCNEQKLFAFSLPHNNVKKNPFPSKSDQKISQEIRNMMVLEPAPVVPGANGTLVPLGSLQSSGLGGKADGQLSRLCPVCCWEPGSCQHQPLCACSPHVSVEMSQHEKPFLSFAIPRHVYTALKKVRLLTNVSYLVLESIHHFFKEFILPLLKKRNKIHSRSCPEICSNSPFFYLQQRQSRKKAF